ncbi:MAG: IS1 family transposase, partial [Candidatus Aenigmarchaeota archaeon]|nr:IS1 family transposase [Candidatus Aenigmarchaeota archaeon]
MDVCPYCNSKLVKKEGKRKLKYSIIQKYRCLDCNKYFADKDIRHKSYPAKIILNTISTYNLGYTLEQTKKEIAKRFHIRIPESTIHSWIKQYSDVCTFYRLREQAIKFHKPEEMIFSHNIQHNQIYKYQLHKAKFDLLSKELQPQKFQLLKAYIEKIPTGEFPHHIFQPKQDMELPELARSSQIKFDTFEVLREEKQNLANLLASLGLQLAKTNKERHEAIQNFMITNDSVSVACEVPVFLTGDDIKYFNMRPGFNLPLDNYQTPITGHIDALQIRNGLIHILDYKPDA